MKSKRNMFLLFGAAIAAILLLFVVIFSNRSKTDVILEGIEKGSVERHNVEEVQANPSIYGQTNISEEDADDANSPNKVIVENTDFFQYTTLKSDAWMIFPTFLAEYLSKRSGEEQWHATLLEGTFYDDKNFPYFYCVVEELPGIEIKCNYSRSDGIYFFRCPAFDSAEEEVKERDNTISISEK